MLNSKGASRLIANSRTSLRRGGGTFKRSHNPSTHTTSTRIVLPFATQCSSNLFQSRLYNTEKVIEYKSGLKKEFQPRTLYRAENETENCGVGLVASLKSVPSRKVVEQADEMLVRMSHRGGCGCDPASGDGAGELQLVT